MTQPAPQPRDPTPATRDIVVGATVYGADNGRFGQVAGSYRNFLIVERGFFMPVDYYVPMSAVSRVDGDIVVLSVSRDAALTQGWERPPFTSETGQRGTRRPTVGRPSPAGPAGSPAASWPKRPSHTADPGKPADAPVLAATTLPGPTEAEVAAGATISPDTGSDPVVPAPAEPLSASSIMPATGAFADTYAVGTNTESYHAMAGFPADPVPPTPDVPASERDRTAPAIAVAGPVVTPPAGTESADDIGPANPEDAAAGSEVGEGADASGVAKTTMGSAPDRPVASATDPTDSPPSPATADADAPTPAERPAP